MERLLVFYVVDLIFIIDLQMPFNGVDTIRPDLIDQITDAISAGRKRNRNAIDGPHRAPCLSRIQIRFVAGSLTSTSQKKIKDLSRIHFTIGQLPSFRCDNFRIISSLAHQMARL